MEQRKRLTIGVELAAKPDLLLFLDEPTSGLYVFLSPFDFTVAYYVDQTRASQMA
jgi:ATP-binding cassette, subfamily G (WHITE), member 2, PDR